MTPITSPITSLTPTPTPIRTRTSWLPSGTDLRTPARVDRRRRARPTTRRHAGTTGPIRRFGRRLGGHVPTAPTPSELVLDGIRPIDRYPR